jgi:hypothetical protein
MASVRRLTVLMADPEYRGKVPKGPSFSLLSPSSARISDVRKPGMNLFVISAASGLGPVAELVHEANSTHKLRALFVRADVDCAWFLPMLEKAKLRTLRNMIVHSSPGVPERVLHAWEVGAQQGLIADATVAHDRLMVRSCSLDQYQVAFSEIPSLARLAVTSRSQFTIDLDGSFLQWEDGDIHVGLDTIRYAIDPEFKSQTDLRRLSSQARFGRAIAELRSGAGLRQTDIPGVSAKEVSRIESGAVSPRLQTIRRLASAHKTDSASYLNALAGILSQTDRAASVAGSG